MMDNERLTAFFKPHDPPRVSGAGTPSHYYDPIASQAKILSSALSAHIVAGLQASLPSTSNNTLPHALPPQVGHFGPPTMVPVAHHHMGPVTVTTVHQNTLQHTTPLEQAQARHQQQQTTQSNEAGPPHPPVTTAAPPLHQGEIHTPLPPPGPPHELDISLYCERNRCLSRDEVYRVLTNAWSPPQEFTFPNSTRYTPSRGLRVLRFHRHWLQAYPFLAYSASKFGVYCRYCVLFGTRKVGGTPLGAFVTKPFKTYRKFHEKCRKHSARKYHLEATRRAVEYKMRYETREDVTDLLPSPSGCAVFPVSSPKGKGNNAANRNPGNLVEKFVGSLG